MIVVTGRVSDMNRKYCIENLTR